jgi:N-formylglutamate deformylase
MKLYNLHVPDKGRVPILVSMPHSGTYIPPEIDARFRKNPRPILTNMDWHLEKLLDFLPDMGITVLQATHSRYVVDLNREVKEPLYGPIASSVVFATTTYGSPLYETEPANDEIEARLTAYYYPYHEKLRTLLDGMKQEYGRVVLLDLHSYFWGPETDVCLGNRHGSTCSESVMTSVEQAFCSQGYRVAKNEKWIGGYITRHYSNLPNLESLQIELRFTAYLAGDYFGEEEISEWDCEKFWAAKIKLRQVFSEIVSRLG